MFCSSLYYELRETLGLLFEKYITAKSVNQIEIPKPITTKYSAKESDCFLQLMVNVGQTGSTVSL